MIKVNPRPTYFAGPYYNLFRKRIRGMFSIYERCGQETNFIFRISNRGDRLNNLMKRGIPLDDAKNLFYQLDDE